MDPREITDIKLLQEMLVALLNKQEDLQSQLSATQAQLSAALEEIIRLKGGNGKVTFPAKRGSKYPRGKKIKAPKASQTRKEDTCSVPSVDRTEVLKTPPADLPADAVFKGYRTVYQRNIKISRDNVAYKIARWYSAQSGQYYESALPPDYQGQSGSMLKSFVQMLHHCGDMTQGKIIELLDHLGIEISRGGLSNMLTHNSWIKEEQADLLAASIESSPFVQMDSTTSKEKGIRKYTQVLCGKYFSLFYTQAGRSRLDVYAALQGQNRQQVRLAYTDRAKAELVFSKVSKKHLAYFEQTFYPGQILQIQELEAIFNSVAIFEKTNAIRRSVIAGALAAGYYHQQDQIPIVDYLMSDAAREYRGAPAKKQLHCWVHAMRHYRIMDPRDPYLKNIHAQFLDQLSQFYHRIKSYKELPRKKQFNQQKQLEFAFDRLFGQQTDYHALNKQLALTRKNRAQLLAVLEQPDFPLHNNAAERGARRVVRKRDISFHTWSNRGTRIRDAFLSLHQTAKKLQISFLDYLLDRNQGIYALDSLSLSVKNAYKQESSTF